MTAPERSDFTESARSWAVRRSLISAFVTFHLAALAIWTMPSCAIKDRFDRWAGQYVMPLGLWEPWRMFAPDPPREELALEVVIRDREGVTRTYAFPRTALLTPGRALGRYRQTKFAENALGYRGEFLRAAAARYAVQQSGVAADRFPVEVELDHLAWTIAMPGEPATRSPARRRLELYSYQSRAEVGP